MPDNTGSDYRSDSQTAQKVLRELGHGPACERDLFIRLRPVDQLALHRLLRVMAEDRVIRRFDQGRLPGPVVAYYDCPLREVSRSVLQRGRGGPMTQSGESDSLASKFGPLTYKLEIEREEAWLVKVWREHDNKLICHAQVRSRDEISEVIRRLYL